MSTIDNIKKVIKREWKIIAIIAIVIIAILQIALLTYYLRVVKGLFWADWTGIEERLFGIYWNCL